MCTSGHMVIIHLFQLNRGWTKNHNGGGKWFQDNETINIFRWHAGFDTIGDRIHTLTLLVKIPFFPIELWEPQIFKIIRDSLGIYLKTNRETTKIKNTMVSIKCVEMDISQGIPYVIIIEVRENNFMQTMDYKKFPV